jgi:predicted RNA-binding protein with PIN domain
LRVLLDALTGAAAGIRRELNLPAGVLRPADAVAGQEGPNAGAAVRDAGDLDRLLGVPEVHLIIDGYNVTKTGYPELTLAEQRSRLVAAMGSLRSRSGAEITVTFDGATRLPSQPPSPRGVRVLFSAPDETADDLIRRLVAAEPPGRALLVVTSDQAVVADVRRAGARTVSSQILLDRLARG